MQESFLKTHGNSIAVQQNRRGIRVCQDTPAQGPLVHPAYHLQLHERGPGKQPVFFSQPGDDKSSRQLSSMGPYFRASSASSSVTLAANNPSPSSISLQPVKKREDLIELATELFDKLGGRVSQDIAESPDEVKILLRSIPASALDTLRDCNGKTALEIAVYLQDLPAIRLLVEHGVDPGDAESDSSLAIHVAAEKGDLKLIQLLIDRGADLNVSPDGSDTPLMLAAWRGHLAIVKLLVQNGARLDLHRADKRNVLMAAMQTGQVKVVEFLLGANKNTSHAFDINQQDNSGNTALSMAYTKHASSRLNAWENEKDLQDTIFLLQNQGASKDFLMSRYFGGHAHAHRTPCIERAVRAGLGEEGDLKAKIAFVDAVEAFYHPRDTSYQSLLKNVPVKTRYEEEQGDSRAYLYDSH